MERVAQRTVILKLAGPVGDAQLRESSWKALPIDFRHPFLEKFKSLGPPLFERITVCRFHSLRVPSDSNIQILAELVPEHNAVSEYPFLAVGALGKGRVIFAACPSTTVWSDFPAAKIFVPLMHEIVYGLTGCINRLESHLAGQPVRLDFADCAESVSVSVTFPAGIIKRFTSEPGRAGNFVLIADTYTPGIYPYEISGGKSESDAFVINPDPTEGDLKRVSRADLKIHFPHDQLYLVASSEELETTLARIERGVPLTSALFLIVIVIAVAELFVASRTRPAEVAEAEVKPFASVVKEQMQS